MRSAVEVILHEPIDQRDAVAGGALVVEVAGLVGPDHAGDVEMGPFDALLAETLEEGRGGDRAAFARAAVLHVGDGGVHQLVVGFAERHPPGTVAGLETGVGELRGGAVVVGAPTALFLAQRAASRAGARPTK